MKYGRRSERFCWIVVGAAAVGNNVADTAAIGGRVCEALVGGVGERCAKAGGAGGGSGSGAAGRAAVAQGETAARGRAHVSN